MSSAVVRGAAGWLVGWLVMYGLWLLLVGSLEPIELGGGALAAAVAATGLYLVRTHDEQVFKMQPGWLLILARRLPLHTMADCGRVLGVLWLRQRGTRVHGRVRRVPFDPGPRDDPYAAGRRALVVAGVSLAPNAVVVRIDGRDLVLHELLPTPAPPSADLEWPL